MAQSNPASMSQAVWCWTTHVTLHVKCRLLSLHLICLTVLMEKKCPVVKTGKGLENMECHADA